MFKATISTFKNFKFDYILDIWLDYITFDMFYIF